jgi:hypothetical protein
VRASRSHGSRMNGFPGIEHALRKVCDLSFRRLGFSEKKSTLDALEGFFANTDQAPIPGERAAFPMGLCVLGERLCGGGEEGRGNGKTRLEPGIPGPVDRGMDRFPVCVGRNLVKVARGDPFPRVRRAAVRVLIRLGDPDPLGARLQDYLCGLLSANAVSSCTVLQFILTRFGPSSLKWVIVYMDEQGRKFSPVMIRLLEGYCEEAPKGLDPQWGLMQLKKRCLQEPGSPEKVEIEEWETGRPGLLSYMRHTVNHGSVRLEEGLSQDAPAARGPGPGRAAGSKGKRYMRSSHRTARERFERIRSMEKR